MLHLQPVEMRLQYKHVINNCTLINDSYSNDLSGLRIALSFLQQQAGKQATTVILSDLGETESSADQYGKVLQALLQYKVQRFVGIGPRLHALRDVFAQAIPLTHFFTGVAGFLQQFPNLRFSNEAILLKGARAFEFEQIDLQFEEKVHQTVLEVNLTAMANNLREYQKCLQPHTKVMAMVKAFSYGSGSAEVARVLQYHKVDYLAVAYADEGVELRKAGINMPIVVMNPEPVTFQLIVQYGLEPEMYSFSIINAFSAYLQNAGLQQYPIHIKIDTGMHRLGFEEADLDLLSGLLGQTNRMAVKSVFSHLAASEAPQHDSFTHLQVQRFKTACARIRAATGYAFMQHIANSAAIFRFPQYQFDMVRLGIGLYGIDSTAQNILNLQPVASLLTTVAQVRNLPKGESVGYGRRGKMPADGQIATIRIGYADGFSRRLGNGTGKVFINGQLAPVIGSVCMDMTMVDITGIADVHEGTTAEVFGTNLSIQQVAQWIETIPYEVMTGISQRVRREYYEE